MGRAIAIVLALGTHGEAADATGAANRVKAVLAASQQLVDIGLMADIPDELVLGRAENVVQRQSELDDAEVRAKVSAVFGEDRDQFLPNFFGQLLQLVQR